MIRVQKSSTPFEKKSFDKIKQKIVLVSYCFTIEGIAGFHNLVARLKGTPVLKNGYYEKYGFQRASYSEQNKVGINKVPIPYIYLFQIFKFV